MIFDFKYLLIFLNFNRPELLTRLKTRLPLSPRVQPNQLTIHRGLRVSTLSTLVIKAILVKTSLLSRRSLHIWRRPYHLSIKLSQDPLLTQKLTQEISRCSLNSLIIQIQPKSTTDSEALSPKFSQLRISIITQIQSRSTIDSEANSSNQQVFSKYPFSTS